MPPVVRVEDRIELVATKNYPYATFPFENFNPIQSRLFEYYDKKNNCIVASSTASGKTVIAELFLAHEIRKNGGKGLYLVPMKALAQEKIDDWTSKEHHFGDLKVSICTGDYRLTPARKAELEAADLIIMTSEMLSSRCRNLKSERSEFLKKVGVLVSDEVHLLTVPGRGDHLEVGLMKFTEMNPDCRLVLLSATMPNVEEISDWVSYILTKKDTVLLKSKYRPCPLNIHYEKYTEGNTYDETEKQKVNLAMQIIEYYPDDKFIIFCHTKRTGEMMKKALINEGITCDFHSADLSKDKRISLENKFKKDKNFRILVATSTIAWGVNLPSRRVIILGVHRGLNELDTWDIWQMVGRSGRPLYDPVGDAYILLPEKFYNEFKEKIRKPQKIVSQMLEPDVSESESNKKHHKVLAFHIVSEIHQENITTKEDVNHWYSRSLACFQDNAELPENVVSDTLDSLKKCGAIWEEDGKYTATSVGKIASMFYYSPFDVSDLKKNFNALFDNNKDNDDVWLSYALGNIDTNRGWIVSKAEREEMSGYASQIRMIPGKHFEGAVKAGFAYYVALNSLPATFLNSTIRTIQSDFPRLNQVLQALDGFTGKWNKKNWFKELQLRLTYGVKGHLVGLCQLPNIGKVKATKLWNAGVKNIDDVLNNSNLLKTVAGLKSDKVDEVLAEAKKLKMLSAL